MRAGWGAATLIACLSLAACDGREESAIDNLANGANSAQVENSFRAEAREVLEPLRPPEPGTPGGLPPDAAPIEEGKIDLKGPQGAAQVVQGYYALLEQRRFDDAQDLWNEKGTVGAEDDEAFARRFRNFSEIHANIGAPGEMEGGAGSSYVTVPVQVYGRLAANGKPWYMLRQVTLRRVNDVPESSEADRRWHIEAIGPYVAPVKGGAAEVGDNASVAH